MAMIDPEQASDMTPHFVYPIRRRVGRSAGKQRATASGIEWKRPEEVPGAILPPEVERRLNEKLRAIYEAQARAAVSAHTYVIYR